MVGSTGAQQSVVFDPFYLSVSEMVDNFSMKYVNAPARLNTTN